MKKYYIKKKLFEWKMLKHKGGEVMGLKFIILEIRFKYGKDKIKSKLIIAILV